MAYSYSKPVPSPEYRTPNPPRVSPVGASSFHGGSGGGGIFPFLPFSGTDSGEVPYEEAAELASENALEYSAEQASEQTGYDSLAESAKQWIEKQKEKSQVQPEKAEQPVPDTVEKIRMQSNLFSDELAKRNAENARTAQMNSTDSTGHSVQYVSKGQRVIEGASGQRAGGAGQAEGGQGAGQRLDRVISSSGADTLPDAVTSGSGRAEELRYRSFADVEEFLPSDAVSFKTAPADEPYKKEDPITATKPLKTSGQMSFGNVQNLPVPDTSLTVAQNQQSQSQSFFGQAAQFGSDVLKYVSNYQADKMQNPVREIGLQTGASLLAAPLIGAVGVSAVPAAVAPAVSQVAQQVIPQASTAVSSNNIVSFADYAKKAAGAAAAAGAISQALPAAAQSSGWNPAKQTYTAPAQKTTAGVDPVSGIGAITTSVKKTAPTIVSNRRI